MKKINLFSFILLSLTFMFSCGHKEVQYPRPGDIAISWELITNFTETKGVFEAKFTLKNNSNFVLTNSNWALFFNIAPRPIVDTPQPQPGRVQHIDGDWYKLVPTNRFSLKPIEEVEILYRGKDEAVIKETDGPLGAYFVFYDDKGKEDKILEIEDVVILPFTRPEQIKRNENDFEPLPTPENRYQHNLNMTKLDEKDLKMIIPTPVKLVKGEGVLVLNDNLTIGYAKELKREAGFLAGKLKDLTGSEYKIAAGKAGDPGIMLQLGEVEVNGVNKEAYKLSVSEKGVVVTGSDPTAVFYGLQSLLAMVPLEVYKSETKVINLQHVKIADAPRFAERALHVDVSRNFQTKETLKRILDMLAFYKVNQFLFYTTEDEGWRLEIDGLPELTQVGAQREHTWGKDAPALNPAYGSGPYAYAEGKYGSGFYTREDFIEILKYADERHIKVIPELNFPAHARAAIKAMEARYNRLMKEGKEEEANEYRLIDPEDRSEYMSAQSYTDNVVSVARESTYHFYEKVVDEIAEMYKAAGLKMDVIHAGGDEVPEGVWTKSPMAINLLKEHPEIKDPHNLQAYFFRKLLKLLEKRDLRVDGWEEVALIKNENGEYEPNPEFADRNVVPYVWNNLSGHQDLGYRLANFGYKVMICNVSNFYFDLAYNNDPKEPGLYWAGFVNTRDAWTFAPYDVFITTTHTMMGKEIDPEKEYADMERLKPEARKNIIGLEAHLWSETIKGRKMIEYYLLPKLMGFAESAWSAERRWEVISEEQVRNKIMTSEWNIFANTLAKRELPRLRYINGGYNYRIPLPGAVVSDGILKANVEFPGLVIRYTEDGSEPNERSPVYEGPVKVQGIVKLKSFDASGKSSRVSIVGE